MKQITDQYKESLLKLGREYDIKVTYGNTTLTNEQLNEVTPHYRADLLKSVMKQLDLDSNVDIPIGTEINCQFGLKVGNSYEYIDYGNYIVYSSEKQEDLDSYRIVCYDKMLYAMKDYEDLEITYPISIKDYISAIATKIGLEFEDDDFTNADKEIPEEKYLDEDGNTLGYTYRDVLDELAQVTASIIKVEDNKLKITYPDDVIAETSTFENTIGQITTDSKKVLDLDVEGNTYQETTILPSEYTQVEYIQSDHSSYIDTNIALSSKFKIELEFTLARTYTGEQPIISTWNSSNKYWNLFVRPSNAGGNANLLDLYVNTHYNLSTTQVQVDAVNYVSIERNNDNWSTNLNGTLTTFSSSNLTDNSTTVKIFKRGDINNGFYGYIRYVKIVDNGTLVRHLIPCFRNNDNVIGMYDLVNKVFYTNAGEGSFTKGSNSTLPNPNYPQEIQVVTGNQEIEVVGKNLIKNNSTGGTYGGITYTINEDKSITVNGTATSNYTYYVFGSGSDRKLILPAGTYTLSGGINNNCWVRLGGDTLYDDFGNGTTITITQKTSFYVALRVKSGTTVNNLTFKPMLEKGNQATEYEHYISNKYEINLGKNLINTTAYNKTANSSGVVQNASSPNYYLSIDDYVKVEPNTTYSISFENDDGGNLYTSTKDKNGTFIARTNLGAVRTFTTGNNVYQAFIYLYKSNGTYENVGGWVQLEKGQPTEYSPYFTPIELCKINDYKDSIKKSEGKNLFDKDNFIEINAKIDSGSIVSHSAERLMIIECKPNTTYSFTKLINSPYQRNYVGETDIYPIAGGSVSNTASHPNDTSFSYTTTANAKYIVWWYYCTGSTTYTKQQILDSIMVNEGSTPLPYEPYGKDKWYIEKNIGKVVLDGNTTPTSVNTSLTNTTRFFASLDSNGLNNSPLLYCNRLIGTTSAYNQDVEGAYISTNLIVVRINKSLIGTTTSTIETWLGSNNLIAYYPLATPTYTEITNEELISQLNSIELIDGLNNISITSSNLSSPLKISYISEYETITEDYLKDVNVNFSEKFGPVNSLVLSRSADSDLIYRKDDSSIEKNGLTEIKISDNQILNGNDRDEYIDNIFNRLKGIEYYTNDYDSTGITYLELGDFYKVEARGNRYLALMLNDELNVTQGFEELIHTDKPDTSVSDYKKADTTDRRINKATLIVDKQNQTIQALTSRTSNLESKQINDKAELLAKFGDYALDSRVDDITTQVETLQTDTYTKTEVKSILKGTFYDGNNQIVSEVVKTTSGTFDENGMHYEKTNAKTKSTINEVGVRVDNAINDSELLFAGYDDNINQTIVRTDNLTVRNFLVVGSQSRFQDYEENNEQGTGVFDL